ncbi:MAG: apolipoprotein N-acyltransferase [Candidatus Omnitrophota bacterium]|nr:apolipoprotein N-acyltransferase [Candidatus Omnitrophota bacterium]
MSRRFLDYILCILSSILLALSFPKFNFWFFGWVGLLPLFFALQGKRPIFSFLLSYLTGFLFFLLTIYWLIHVTLLGFLLLAAYLAIYFGLFGFLIGVFSNKPPIFKLFLFPSIWVVLEFLRSNLLSGFGWALLGYSQYRNLAVIQISDILGSYGVSFLIVMVNVAIWVLVSEGRGQRSEVRKVFFCLLSSVFCLLAVISYGLFKLNYQLPTTNYQQLKVSVIQGNIPQEIKWDETSWPLILDKYINLTRQVSKDKPSLIIWPETAYPGYLADKPQLLKEILNLAKELRTNFLLGAITTKDFSIYNSAILISSEGKLSKAYHKLHLVPFGEYVPFRGIFSFLPELAVLGDFTKGKEYTVFSLNKDNSAKFSVLICFEDTIPYLSRQFVKKGANLLINITNDAWFKDTSAPFQHLQASVFRAIENRCPLVRCANTGVSAFIDENGRIIDMVLEGNNKATFISGYKTKEIKLKNSNSFYSRFGDLFVLACLLIFISGIFKFWRISV